MTLRELMTVIHKDNIERGWWEGYSDMPLMVDNAAHRSAVIEKLCLVHSEISEALEEVRQGNHFALVGYERGTKPVGFPTEIADAIIRLLDLAAACGIDRLDEVIDEKLAYNRTRGHRYGGKLA